MPKEKAIENALKQFTDNAGALNDNENIQRFAEERNQLKQALKGKNPIVKEYIRVYGDMEKHPHTNIGRMAREMKNIAAKQEVLAIAAELCNDEKTKNELLIQREKLNNAPAMVAYNNYIKGLKYLAGMTDELTAETRELFENKLRVPVLEKDNFYEQYRTGEEKPALTNAEKARAEYQRQLAPAKARQLFSTQALSYDAMEREFFADYPEHKRTKHKGIGDRMTPVGFCIGKMLRDGHRLEDILDPTKLQNEKMLAGREYQQKRESGDLRWIAEGMYKNAEAMIEAFNKYAKYHKDTLKTEQDLVTHMNKLGVLSACCYDLMQELPNVKGYISPEFKTEAEIMAMTEEIGKYNSGAGDGVGKKIVYEPERLTSLEAAAVLADHSHRQKFLQEVQKDDPDFSNNLLTGDEVAAITNQINTLPEFEDLFSESGDFDLNGASMEDVKEAASMMSYEFLEKNGITYDHARVPLKVAKKPAFTIGLEGDIKEGDVINKAVRRGNKQILKTNVPARMDLFLKNMEKKNMRGKEKDNSTEFNNLLKTYDDVVEKMGDGKATNQKYLEEMAKLKDAAAAYMVAKREQKGYDSKEIPNAQIDKQLLGKEKGGPGIFTSRGKTRYEFAMRLVSNINVMEKELKAFEEKQLSDKNPVKKEKEIGGQEIGV